MKKINEGINKAGQKGCKDSVILYKDTALVTSIKNRTIITALSKNGSEGNVFTNIDSLIIL
jgi:flagellar operon protein